MPTGTGPLAALIAQLTSPAPPGGNPCQCISPPVPCGLVAGFTSAYDPASNKLFERHLHAECRSHLYPADQYDSADRLLQYQRGLLNVGGQGVAVPISLAGTDDFRSYALDLVGNWDGTSFRPACGDLQTETRSNNELNQITQIVNGTVTTDLHYDGSPGNSNGNLIADGVRQYSYDALNRLREVRRADGTVIAQYRYDAGGRRVQKVVLNGGLTGDLPNGTTDYVYAGGQCLEEVQDGVPQRQYVWGSYVDELLQQRELAGQTPADFYPLSDLLHRTVALTDANGNIVAVYDTDAYGQTLMYNGPGPDGQWFTDDDQLTDNPLCPYLFTGRRFDPETELYFYRARYYDPALGRFLSRDPIGYAGGMGLYEYVAGNPTVHLDPSGEFLLAALAVAAIVVTGVVITRVAADRAEQASIKGDVQGFNDALAWFRGGLVVTGIGAALIAWPALMAVGGWAAGGLGLASESFASAVVSGAVAGGLEGLAVGALTEATFAYSIGAGAGDVAEAALWGGLQGAAWGTLAGAGLGAIRWGAGRFFRYGGPFESWLRSGASGGLRRNALAWRLNTFRRASSIFYSVQGEADAARLARGGLPWPTEVERGHLGLGLYTFGKRVHAMEYLARLEGRGYPGLRILAFRAQNKVLDRFRMLDMRTWSDDAVNSWLTTYSRFYQGAPHRYQYIIRNAGVGPEHYFRSDVYKHFRSSF